MDGQLCSCAISGMVIKRRLKRRPRRDSDSEEKRAWPLQTRSNRLSSSSCRSTRPKSPRSQLSGRPGRDSLDVVELVMQFEEAFDIEIPDESAERSRPSRTRLTTSKRSESGK